MFALLTVLSGCTAGDDSVADDTAPPREGMVVEAPRPWNVVVVMTDDQRADSLWAMPLLAARLEVDEVAVFSRAYAPSPLCCPARASLFSGGFAPHETNVLTNDLPNGGITRFRDVEGLAVQLERSGYVTALFGKYMNGLETSPVIPPGWNTFEGLMTADDWWAWDYISAKTGPDDIRHDTGYLTDALFDRAHDVLRGPEPFALFVTPLAPHLPAEPATEDVGAYAGTTLRPPSYREEDMTDKPAAIRKSASEWVPEVVDAQVPSYFESLLAVDRKLDAMLNELEASGRLDHTLVVFTSDHGYLWGEHGLVGKGYPYEESVRTPLVVWRPGFDGPRVYDQIVNVGCDLAATVQAVAGVRHEGSGLDLGALLDDASTDWRTATFLEGYHTVFAGVVTATHKYVEYQSGEFELYDLVADPYEMDSLHLDPEHAGLMAHFAQQVDAQRGLWVGPGLITIPKEVTVAIPLTVRGGLPPYTFRVPDGQLPHTLELKTDGVLRGTLGGTKTWAVDITVEDASSSPARLGPLQVTRTIQIAPSDAAIRTPVVAIEGDAVVVDADGLRAPVLRWSLDPDMDMARTTPFVALDATRWQAPRPPQGRHALHGTVWDGAREVVPAFLLHESL